MKKSMFVLFVVVVLGMLVLTACGGSAPAATTTRPAAPAEFASKTNPVAGNADAIAKDKEQYTAICLACHGEKGLGDGPAGAALNPKPGKIGRAHV